MAVPPPGSIVVAVKIVPLPEKKDPRLVPADGPADDPAAGGRCGLPDRLPRPDRRDVPPPRDQQPLFDLDGSQAFRVRSVPRGARRFPHDQPFTGGSRLRARSRGRGESQGMGKGRRGVEPDDRPGRHGADAESRRHRAGGSELRAGQGGAAEGVFQVLQRVRDERHPRGAPDDVRLRRGQRPAAGGLHGLLPVRPWSTSCFRPGDRPSPGR